MKLGVADTCFARVDMAQVAIAALRAANPAIKIERYTVPGFKDLPVAAKKLIEEYQCEAVLALGWVGDQPIDEQCAHEASLGLIGAQLLTNRHIVTCFVHSKESGDEQRLKAIALDRAAKHALNTLALLKGKEELTKFAGKGLRQGSKDTGSIR